MLYMIKEKLVEIVGKEFKVIFEWSPKQKGYGYTLIGKDKEKGWKKISANENPLVRGLSFELYPQEIKEKIQGVEWEINGKKTAENLQGELFEYSWDGTIRYNGENDWIDFEINVHNQSEIKLQMKDGFEPEITVNMGLLPPYDRGDHVWFKTSINNPTKWNDEAYGNDLPALYYYDSYYHFDIMMFFDMTSMSWMSRENIARFLNYRCGFRRSYKPAPAHELGLYADGFSGHTFPKGTHTFKYYLKARTKLSPPKETTALKELIDHCLMLVPAESKWPTKATDWEDFTERCTTDLMDPQCWNSNETFDDFILNYVNGYSPAWQEAFEAKNLKIDFKEGPCIDSAAWIAFPLIIVDALKGKEDYKQLLDRIVRFTKEYVKNKAESIQEKQNSGNAVYREGFSGTWQYAYILEQLWQVAHLSRDQDILNYVYNELDQVLIPLAKNVSYLFPLAFDMSTLNKCGNGDGYSIAGLYSYFMINLYKTTNEEKYLNEAENAIKPLIQMPINSLSQEAFLFSLGLQAASELYKITANEDYREIYEYLLAQNLRMMYWFDDNTQEEYKDYNIFGMFQACTPIIYPAFFENVECLARIASTLDTQPASKGLLYVFNHARKNNLFMFPQCLPENRHTSNLKYIPYENVGVLEDEKTGWIGQEIYGCGQVYQAYLMWEAFGKSKDRNILVLNLNNYKFLDTGEIHDSEWNFIVFNPESEEKHVEIQLSISSKDKRAWIGSTMTTCEKPVPCIDGVVQFTLLPSEYVYMKISK
jgi:hypothetical protein